MSTIITVADVRPPAPGKKQASVIDSAGKRWGIPVNEMTNYRQFGSYDIVKFKESFFQGKTYYTIESAVAVPNGQAPAPQQGSTPKTYTPPSDDIRRMDIFVSVMINNSDISPHSMSEQALVEMIQKFKRVWKGAFGPQPDPISSNHNDDMSDSIPF